MFDTITNKSKTRFGEVPNKWFCRRYQKVRGRGSSQVFGSLEAINTQVNKETSTRRQSSHVVVSVVKISQWVHLLKVFGITVAR